MGEVASWITPRLGGLTISGDTELAISGYEARVEVYGSSTATVLPGADISWLDGYDDSTINIQGGDISWLSVYDNSQTNISSLGDLSWLHVYDDSQTNISSLGDLSWLVVNDQAIVNIYGSGFDYSDGHLSGIWSNGGMFSFWALEEADFHSGNIGDLLPDNIILHTISAPEPASVVIFAAGILLLAASRSGGGVGSER